MKINEIIIKGKKCLILKICSAFTQRPGYQGNNSKMIYNFPKKLVNVREWHLYNDWGMYGKQSMVMALVRVVTALSGLVTWSSQAQVPL